MHCTACDKLLTDYEATRKDAHTFKFIDLCKTCFEDIKPFVSVIDRKDLITEQDLDTIDDDMDTNGLSVASLEDVDAYIDYVVDYREDYDV
jgi:hypothetical protein